MWKILFLTVYSAIVSQALLKEREGSRHVDDPSTGGYYNEHNDPWSTVPRPQLTTPPQLPFLPLSIGHSGAPAHTSDKIDIVKDVIQMTLKIAKEIRNPDELTGQHTLTSFNIMVHLLKTAHEDQLKSITDQLYVKLKFETDPFQYACWVVFRDAVIHAGTGPSILSLQKWIKEDYIYGEEAAQLVSTLTNTAEYPTEEFMRIFFEIVKDADERELMYVDTNSVLAFTSLIKKVYVCRKSMVRRFPVYVFGKPVTRNTKDLDIVFLPYLKNKLGSAVEREDSHKIQVYIRALGNTAHPLILQIFEPYLTGKKKLTDFQRLLIVTSLDSMTLVYPNLVRPILYNIYLNVGESSEIRTQAVSLIMRTNPSAEILQRMAASTKFESSDHVKAAVKSAIESASAMDSGDELARNAKEAVNILTSANYGLHYSTNYIRSLKTNENLGYKLRWNHIQSSGCILPSSFFITNRPNLGGFTQRAYKYSWMSSSMDDLLTLLDELIISKNDSIPYEDSTWTPANIAKMLNIQQEDRKRVEGNIYYTLHGARRFITYDNHTIKEITRLVKFASSAFRLGESFNYTKMYNQFSLRIAFPTATGLPFVYTLENPTIVSLIGEAHLNSYPDLANGLPEKILPPLSLNWTSDFRFLFSSKTESKLGFVAPFSSQHFLAGYDTNSHLHLPLRIRGDIDNDNNKIWVKLQPLYPHKYQKLTEFSSMAYTTKHNILNLEPPQLSSSVRTIHNKQTKKSNITLGNHVTGFAFDFKSESQEKDDGIPALINSFRQHDLLSWLMFYDKKTSIQPSTNYSIYLNPYSTTARFAKFVINYADIKEYAANEKSIDPLVNDAITTAGIGEHKKRVEELLKRSLVGMRDTYAQAMDISAEFEGNKTSIVSVAGAYARSHVSEKARYLFYFSMEPSVRSLHTKPHQVALDVRAKLPNVPLGNFEEAIKSDPTSTIVARLNFGEKAESEVVFKGQVEKSPERMNYLLNLPLSKLCLDEMNSNNLLLQACHNVTTRANFMDHIYFRIDYQNISVPWQETSYNYYSMVRHLIWQYLSENLLNQTNPSNRIEFDATFHPELYSFNALLITPTMTSKLTNVRINKYFQPVLVMHPHYTIWDRIHERIMFANNAPRCVADNSTAVTFDNKTYPMFIGHCWHTLLHFRSESRPEVDNQTWSKGYAEDVNILIRNGEDNKRDLMIILGGNVVRFHADSSYPTKYFVANDEKYDLSDEIVGHFEDKSGKTLVQAYNLPTGNMRIFTPEHGLIIFYDGLRVEIQASTRYRGKVRGLCGTFDGEVITDFKSPQNCILRCPAEFTAAFSISDGTCGKQVEENRKKAESAPCLQQTFTPSTIVLRSQDSLFKRYEMLKNNYVPKNIK